MAGPSDPYTAQRSSSRHRPRTSSDTPSKARSLGDVVRSFASVLKYHVRSDNAHTSFIHTPTRPPMTVEESANFQSGLSDSNSPTRPLYASKNPLSRSS